VISRILRRTERRDNKPMRQRHDSIERYWQKIVAPREHHPPTGRIEALKNNWETLVRRTRGYRARLRFRLRLRAWVFFRLTSRRQC
jgi:transposase